MLGRSWVDRALLLLLGFFHQTTDAHGTHITSFEDGKACTISDKHGVSSIVCVVVLSSQPHAHDFAVVSYVSITSADESLAPDAPYPSSMHVHFRTSHGTDLEFDVRLKRDLFAADSFVWAHDGPELALLKSHKPHHIAYEGKVPHGYIRLTMFDRHMFHATIKLHDKIVVVDPVGHHKNAHHLSSPVTGMVAYTIPLASATLSNQHHRQLTSFGRMAGCTWSSRQITVGVASDAGFTSEHGAAQTQSYLIAVYNSVNGLFDDQIGVHLTIGAFLIETGVGGPAWNVEPGSCGAMADMDVHLDVIKAWVAAGDNVPMCNQENCGLWHVHTNCDADGARTGSTAGVAWMGSLCSSSMGLNTGVSIDAGVNTWMVVGHEIGHNFGASHTFAEGGIMSYDWGSPTKFYDNGEVCSFVQSGYRRCVGAAYHDSTDCAGQKYMQCNESSIYLSVPPPPKDPSIRSSSVCAREKLRRCSPQGKSSTHWVVNEWSKCSAQCGGGVKNRTVTCMDQKNVISFTDSSCSAPKPIDTLKCNALVDGLFPYDVTDDSDTEHMLTWMTADGATDYIDHKSDNSCNDLALPPGMTQELFDGLIQHVQARKKLVLTFQGGRYAKVDMHHMWADVLQRIDKIIADPEHAPKLSITIGKQTSDQRRIGGICGARSLQRPAALASVLLGLYVSYFVADDVENGQVDLCEWTVFNDTFAFAREWRPCAVPTTSMSAVPTDRRWKPHGLHWVASAVMFSGCVSMTVVMMRELRHRQEDPTTRYLLA
ncbi:hypothetical protein B5M09_006724 [Aphanomyces astaci]|uniref:Peptidase M12B domain-containing protein n=1 Tax=Aphanomyces astaci TaxID=112090 RepID=A0A3R7WLZ2_APHAT|nr:hypothetical protein B5M09_006724 [Aphanomyces astaci]